MDEPVSDKNPTVTPSALSAGLGAWLPADAAPKDGTKILVWESCGEFAISHWYELSHYEYEPAGDLFRRVEIKSDGDWNSNHFDLWQPLVAPNVELTGARFCASLSNAGLGMNDTKILNWIEENLVSLEQDINENMSMKWLCTKGTVRQTIGVSIRDCVRGAVIGEYEHDA